MADEIIIDITGRLDKLEQSLKQAEATMKDSGDKMSKALDSSLGKGLNGLKTTILAVGTAILGGLSLQKVIGEASEAQVAINDFNKALANAGKFSKETSQRFLEFAQGIQNVTTVSDDAIVKNAAFLVSVGQLSGAGLERATKAAVDLSAGLGVDLNTAFTLVGKAAAGNTDALSRYGIKIDESIPKSERFSFLLERINASFGGAAESKVNTFSGAMAQLGNNFSDFAESIGNLIIKSPVVVAIIGELATNFKRLTATFEGFGKNGDIVGDIIKNLLVFGQIVITGVVAPLEVLFNFGKIVFNSLKLTLQGFIVALATVPEHFAQIIGNMIQMTSAVGDIVGVFNQSFGDKIKASIEGTANDVKAFGDTFLASSTETFNQFADQTTASIDNAFDLTRSFQASNFLSNLQVAADGAKAITTDMTNVVGANFNNLGNKVDEVGKRLGAVMKQGIVSTVSNSIQALVGALLKGQAGFDAFLKAVLSSLGDLAIQMGAVLIAAGIGIESLKSLSGAAAIAAGAGLIALGTILKALGGGASAGGSGASAATPVSGAVPGGDVTQPQAAAFDDRESRDRSTQVAVNIQGNVLDRRQTGLEIAEIIQEQFNNNGQVFASGTA